MRAPFQILAIPYKYENGMPIYCVLHRSDYDQWQFIAGGGEDKESPEEAARREIMEEGGMAVENIISLKNINKSFPLELGGEQQVLFDINFTIKA